MKRLVIAALVLALVGAFAFADGTASWAIKTWTGFGIFSSSVSGSSPVVTPYDYDWVGQGAVRFGFKYTSTDGNAGFNSRIQLDPRDLITTPGFTHVGGYGAVFNQVNGWGKLFNGMVTVRAGILDDYTIATADWYTFGTTDGKVGIYVDLAPIEGLDIGYFQPIPAVPGTLSSMSNGVTVGAAYVIKDIANIQLGAVLAEDKSPTVGTAIYFGAKVTAVKDLTAILEGKAVLAEGATPITLLENLGYTMGALTIGARIGESLNGSVFNWGVEPIVTYKVNDNLGLNVIANIYSDAGQTWMSPLDAGVGIGGGVSGTVNFGVGAFVTWAASGFRVTVGDYYAAAAAPAGGNLIFVNADLAL